MAEMKTCSVCSPPREDTELWICGACRDDGWRLCPWCDGPISDRAAGTLDHGDLVVHDVCLAEILEVTPPAPGAGP